MQSYEVPPASINDVQHITHSLEFIGFHAKRKKRAVLYMDKYFLASSALR